MRVKVLGLTVKWIPPRNLSGFWAWGILLGMVQGLGAGVWGLGFGGGDLLGKDGLPDPVVHLGKRWKLVFVNEYLGDTRLWVGVP